MARMLTHIAGVNHRPGAREHIPKLLDGEGLTLVREPRNRFDRNAVAVYDGRLQLGYVPAVDAPAVARALDSNVPISCRVNRGEGGLIYYGIEITWDSQ